MENNIENIENTNVEAPKASKKTKAKTTEESFTDVVGFDPKNRTVLLTRKSGLYLVTKEGTGFKSKGTKDLKKAQSIFDFQINCSQNQ